MRYKLNPMFSRESHFFVAEPPYDCYRKLKPIDTKKIGSKPPVQALGRKRGVPDMQLSFVIAKN